MVPEPENLLNNHTPQTNGNGNGANDGTFIQNITNNYILDQKKKRIQQLKKDEI
jgi:hypothetical protein